MAEIALFDSLELFSNGSFNITYFIFEDEYYFKAIDVARELKYKDPKKAIQTHVKDKYKFCFNKDFLGGMNRPPKSSSENRGGSSANFISLAGLCQILGQSNMPAAEPFQDWMYEQVLPSIIRKGKYEVDDFKQFKAITDKIDRGSENCFKFRKEANYFIEKTKDQKQAERGSEGGKAFWKKHYGMKKKIAELEEENATLRFEKKEWRDKYRQKKLDLDYFRVLHKCLDP